jgi:hypothetical protein
MVRTLMEVFSWDRTCDVGKKFLHGRTCKKIHVCDKGKLILKLDVSEIQNRKVDEWKQALSFPTCRFLLVCIQCNKGQSV